MPFTLSFAWKSRNSLLKHFCLILSIFSHKRGKNFFFSLVKEAKYYLKCSGKRQNNSSFNSFIFVFRFSLLILTMRACWDDLSGFLAIFFLIFFAFVQLFFMILQPNLDDFKSITAALETCFTMMLNKFKFGTMKDTSMTAAVMFFIFAVSCSFILINVLLTIIIEAFEKVKHELAQKGNEYEILDFLKTHARYVAGLEELPPKDNALVDDHSELRKEQKRQQDEQEEEEESLDPNTVKLPEKMDSFLAFINDLYLDGELDIWDKNYDDDDSDNEHETQALQKKLEPSVRLIYNSSDVNGRSPNFSRRHF